MRGFRRHSLKMLVTTIAHKAKKLEARRCSIPSITSSTGTAQGRKLVTKATIGKGLKSSGRRMVT